MLRPPKAAAPLRRRCLSCFDRFTGGMNAPLPSSPSSPRALAKLSPGPARSLADGPRLPRETAVFAADITGDLAEFESVPAAATARFASKYIYLTVVSIKLPSSLPAGGAPRPAANVCYFGGQGLWPFFTKSARHVAPGNRPSRAVFQRIFLFWAKPQGIR